MPGRDVPDARGLALSGVWLQDGLLRVVAARDDSPEPQAPPRDRWLDALVDRHTQRLSRPEFLKAVRALSARYVEQRASLSTRSPLDSAGKRAAFAAFFAPLHYLTTSHVLNSLGVHGLPIQSVYDCGCGTGAAAAAWGMSASPRPLLIGLDKSSWALNEARWNFRTLGLRHITRQGSFVDARELTTREHLRDAVLVFAWSVNEITNDDRTRLLPRLVDAHRQGAHLLVLEPLARTTVPWWNDWAETVVARAGRADEWKFPADLPPRLEELDRAAGFRREHLSARSLWLPAGKLPRADAS